MRLDTAVNTLRKDNFGFSIFNLLLQLQPVPE